MIAKQRNALIALPLVALLASTGAARGAVTNLCPNPGFEQGDGNRPAHWINDNGRGSWSADNPHSGERCLHIDAEQAGTWLWTSDVIERGENVEQLIFSVRARWDNIQDGNGLAVVYHLDANHERIGQSAQLSIGDDDEPSSNGAWRRFVGVTELTDEVKAVRINLRLYKASGQVWFDDVQLIEQQHEPLVSVPSLRRTVALDRGVTIVRGTEGRTAADRIAQSLSEHGVDVNIVEHDAVDVRELERDAVIVGNLVTNDVCEWLYCNWYTFEDRYYPNDDGYVLRPVIDPFGRDVNLLVIGASRAPGFERAADALLPLIDDGESLDVPLTVKTGDGYRGQLTRPWRTYQPWRELREAALYVTTGNRAYAEQYRRYVLDNWFNEDHRDWIHLFYITKTLSWELMHTCDVFSDEERLRITNELLKHMRGDEGYGYGGLHEGHRIRENHRTRAARAFYFGWRHFDRHYDDEMPTESNLWRQTLERFWSACFDTFRSYEDSLSQHALGGSLMNTLDVALMEPQWSADFWHSDRPRLMGERCLAIVNNMGDTVMLGDTSSGDYPASPFAMLAYKLEDGRYLYALNRRGMKTSSTDESIRGFATDSEPVKPVDQIGVSVVPGDPLYFRTGLTRRNGVTAEQGFDKIAFRGGWSPDDDYLMLDGVGGGSHSFDDVNAIGEFATNNRRWLMSPDALRGPALSFHNAVTVARDGLGPLDVGEAAELLRAVDTDGFAYTATRVPDHHGVDWNRHVMHVHDRFFFVVDEMVAREPGDYSFVAGWRSRGDATLKPGLFSAAQDGVSTAGVDLDASQLARLIEQHDDLPFYFFADYDALLLYTEAVGQGATIPIDVPADGRYQLSVTTFDAAGSRGIMQVYLDGEPVGERIDQFNVAGIRREAHAIATVSLTAGRHALRFEAIGKNDQAGNPLLGIHAVQLLPADRAQAGVTPNRFYMHYPRSIAATLDFDREYLGPQLPVTRHGEQVLNIVEQTQDRTLAPGDAACFQNLFYGVVGAEAPRYELRRLNEHCALVRADDTVALIGASADEIAVELDGLAVRGRAFYISPERRHLVEARLSPTDAAAIRAALDAAWQRADAARTQRAAAWDNAPTLPMDWTQPLDARPRSLAADGDRLAVGLDNGQVRLLDAQGNAVGQYAADKAVYALTFADLDADAARELLVGSDDETMVVFDRSMRERWRHTFDFMRDQQPHAWWTLHAAKVRALHVDDVAGDEKPEILAGVGNMHVHCLASTGDALWRTRIEHGVPNVITTADLFGDAKREPIVANGMFSSGGYAAVLDAEGRFAQHYRMGSWAIACPAVTIGDVNGDGQPEIFVGSNIGDVRAYHATGEPAQAEHWHGAPRGEMLWWRNVSRVVRSLSILPREDADDLLVVGSDSGYLIAFDAQGERAWGVPLSSAILFTAVSGDHVIAGCKDGRVFVVNRNGRVAATRKIDGQLTGLVVDLQAGTVIVTTTAPDAVVALSSAKPQAANR